MPATAPRLRPLTVLPPIEHRPDQRADRCLAAAAKRGSTARATILVVTMDENTRTRKREKRWQERLALPVLIAALVSIPAVFLSFLSEPWSEAGRVINLLSGLVLVGETLILFIVTPNRRSEERRVGRESRCRWATCRYRNRCSSSPAR